MSSAALSAFGTLLKLGDGATPTENFVTVAELRTISGPSMSADVLDATTHNTPTPWRRFIAGLLDGGEISFELNFLPQDSTHSYSAGVLKDFVNRTRRNIQIVFPDDDTTTWTCPVIWSAFEMSSDPADILMASVTAKVSGPPTLE